MFFYKRYIKWRLRHLLLSQKIEYTVLADTHFKNLIRLDEELESKNIADQNEAKPIQFLKTRIEWYRQQHHIYTENVKVIEKLTLQIEQIIKTED